MKKIVCHYLSNFDYNIKGTFMKDLLGAMLIHLLIAVLLGWFLIKLIS